MVFNITTDDSKNLSQVSQLTVIKDTTIKASLLQNQFTSMNFDGFVPRKFQYVPASLVTIGSYFISSSSATPDQSSPADAKLIYSIESTVVQTNPLAFGLYFYEITGAGEINKINSASISASSGYVWVYKDDWDMRSPGSNGWMLTSDGNAIFSNVHVRGNINSDTGTIGGANPWYIEDGSLTSGEGASAIGLTTSSYSFYAGNSTASLAPFYVTNTGNLYAQNANITGSITATFGDIAGFTIDTYQLKKGILKNLLSLYDPGFETNWANYYSDYATRTSLPATGTISSAKGTSPVYKKFGLSSGNITVTMTGAPTGNLGIISNFFLPISPSTTYTYSAYIYDPSVMIDALTASFYNSSSVFISSGSQVISTSSSWQRYSYVFTTPSAAAFIKYGIEGATFGDGVGTQQQTAYFDGAQIEVGASATSWDIDSNIRVVSNGQNNEDPFRLYITENTSASTVLLALNPNGILQSRYLRVNPTGDAGIISAVYNNHAFQIGTSSAQHIRMDNFGIQSTLTSSYTYYDPSIGGNGIAYTNSGSTLFINKLGGNVFVGPTSGATKSNLTVSGAITASNTFIVINGASVSLGGSITVTGTGAPTYIQSTQPTGTPSQYLWWDTSGGNLTLWIEDGV